MANTRFVTENGLYVTGNAQFDQTSQFNANVTVAADLLYIAGNLYVQQNSIIVGEQLYDTDIIPLSSNKRLGNTTYQWDGFFDNVAIYGDLTPIGNTVSLGNAANRWIINANTLNLSGAATLSNTITITGNTTLSNTIAVTGNATFSNTINVVGSAVFSNTVNITGALTLSNTISAVNAATFSNTLSVVGAATLSNTIGVTGTATLSNTIGVTGAATFSNTIVITGAATFSNTLSVTGAANALSTFGFRGNVDLEQNLTVTGNTTLNGTVHTINGNVNFATGVLFIDDVNNRVGIANTAPDTALTVGSAANIAGAVQLGSTLGVTGAVTFANTLSITGNVTFINVTNQSNTDTLYVATSANIGTALTVNSTVINAAANVGLAAYTEKMASYTISANGTQNLDLKLASIFKVSVGAFTANVRFINPPTSGTAASATLILQYTGSSTITIQGNTAAGAAGTLKYAYDSAPTLTQTNLKSDIISVVTYDGGATYIVSPSIMNFTT